MPKVARVSAPISIPTARSSQSDSNQFVSVALFSGIGLLVSLIAVLSGVQGAWY